MTVALIACLCMLTTGFLVLLDRKDARATVERNQALDRLINEQEQHRREIQVLLQRIQAPEVAVVRHEVDQATDAPQPAAPNDDEAYWKLSEEHKQAIAELEARENAPFDLA